MKLQLGSLTYAHAPAPPLRGTRQPGSVFLSHTHGDKGLIEATREFLSTNGGGEIFVDWLDEAMPVETSVETIVRLREKIEKSYRFIVLATEDALRSSWVSWELGFADGIKKFNEIALLPVENTLNGWSGAEYASFYSLIEQDPDQEWRVRFPGNEPVCLSQWLHETSGISQTPSFFHLAGCFPKGSRVSLKDRSTVEIEKLVPGDQILSFDKQNATESTSEVVRVTQETVSSYRLINHYLRVTASHQIYANTDFIPVGKLRVGDTLKHVDGIDVRVISIEEISGETKVYNINLANRDGFFIERLLVDNALTKTAVS